MTTLESLQNFSANATEVQTSDTNAVRLLKFPKTSEVFLPQPNMRARRAVVIN